MLGSSIHIVLDISLMSGPCQSAVEAGYSFMDSEFETKHGMENTLALADVVSVVNSRGEFVYHSKDAKVVMESTPTVYLGLGYMRVWSGTLDEFDRELIESALDNDFDAFDEGFDSVELSYDAV